MTFMSALRDALADPHPRESQTRVHDLLARELGGITPGTAISTTGYFNHSWAPDFVLTSRDRGERLVFLRFDTHDAAFVDDLAYLRERDPVFVDLAEELPDTEVVPDEPASESIELGSTLVADVAAIDKWNLVARADSDVKVATNQVVMGGHGRVTRTVAEEIVDEWHEASAAIKSAEIEDLRESLDAFAARLSPVASLDLESDLRTRWVAAGHAIDDFPGSDDWKLAGRSDAEIGRFVAAVLARQGEPTDAQLVAIAEAISASALGHALSGSTGFFTGDRVGRLVKAGSGVWTAKSAYTPPVDDGDTTKDLEWSIGGLSLTVRLGGRRAYFTDVPQKWNRVRKDAPLPRVTDRLDALDSGEVTGVGLLTAQEMVTHELAPTATVGIVDRIRQLVEDDADPAWRNALLTHIDLDVEGTSQTVRIDFRRSVVRVDGGSLPLKTFALLCARYVEGAGDDVLDRLRVSFSKESAT